MEQENREKMEQKIEIEVLLRGKDMSKFLIRHTYSRLGGILGFILSLAAILSLIFFWNRFLPMQRWILGALGFMFTIVQPLLLWNKGKKQVSQEIFQKAFIYQFGEASGMVIQGEHKESFDYSSIRKVVMARDALYVYFTAVSAFVLPKDCCGEYFDVLARRLKNR